MISRIRTVLCITLNFKRLPSARKSKIKFWKGNIETTWSKGDHILRTKKTQTMWNTSLRAKRARWYWLWTSKAKSTKRNSSEWCAASRVFVLRVRAVSRITGYERRSSKWTSSISQNASAKAKNSQSEVLSSERAHSSSKVSFRRAASSEVLTLKDAKPKCKSSAAAPSPRKGEPASKLRIPILKAELISRNNFGISHWKLRSRRYFYKFAKNMRKKYSKVSWSWSSRSKSFRNTSKKPLKKL